MNDKAVELLTSLMAANAAETTGIMTRLYDESAARVQYYETRLPAVLNTIREGGTTREYEAGLTRLANAMHPTSEDLAPYRKQVRRDMGVEESSVSPTTDRG